MNKKVYIFVGLFFVLMSSVYAACPPGFKVDSCVFGYHKPLYTYAVESVYDSGAGQFPAALNALGIRFEDGASITNGRYLRFYTNSVSPRNDIWAIRNNGAVLEVFDTKTSKVSLSLDSTGDVVIDLS
ncbi:hypothetical protein K9L67_00530 [Candidatus Woesearchaeota archaeon]|nr:hypothetical protein [Candidatus Woesearchaeota archaeon]MCF7900692.1 hypothetical protein [Candidatus Woesearchaeota archaeon]MCF8013213.1 hypothetical protein [Candidatus Woesearchaeota archaeon]